MIPKPHHDPEGERSEPSPTVHGLPDQAADALPGIISPLRLSVDFAANTQPGVVSVTMGNGVLRMHGSHAAQESGRLTLSLRWSGAFRAHGLSVGDVLSGGWAITRAESNRLDATRPSVSAEAGDAVLPTVSIVKLESARDDDEFTARIWGEERSTGSAVICGWSRA
ncbi:hypothetical protein [Herbiconiux sp. YIM B11900]|uniref:hypothetical protein n=1 Tax=Herbiconiux sp. YIM B11900 TaxID=3404131 RepID=UPI003F872292